MIDWQRVQELRQEIGAQEFREVVDMFLEESDEVIAGLRKVPGADDLEEKLHFLKGSALNLGFREVAEMCRQGERLAAGGKAGDFDLPGLLRLYADSRAAFLARLRDTTTA